MKKLDIAQRIHNLSLEIKHLVEKYNIHKPTVIDDFKWMIETEFEETEYEVD